MKIYFCDICNESIGLAALKEGKATTIKGKLFCPNCNPLNSVRGGALEGAAWRWTSAALLVVGLLLAGSAFYVGWQARDRAAAVPEVVGQDIAAVRADLGRVIDSLEGLRREQAGSAADLGQIREQQGDLGQRLADQGGRIDQDSRSIEELKTLLTNLRADRELIQGLELADSQMEERLASLGRDMAALEEKITKVSEAPVVADGAADAAAAPAVVELDEETRRYVHDLGDDDAGVRWTAVDRLASTRNPALVEFLLPLLEDPDTFVQYKVIGTLRDWQARQAVARLIALLRDGDEIVREEALEALVSLTGHPLRFDVVDGQPAEREKGVQAWEAWYQENRERFEPAS